MPRRAAALRDGNFLGMGTVISVLLEKAEKRFPVFIP
jgi:hypothetical protein